MTEPIRNALTVDVEDYFQVSAFRHAVRYEDWDGMECRVEQNTLRVLDLLAELGVQGTFFVVGWVAERYPSLVRRIQAAGHELGCHSYAHRLVYELSPAEFRADTWRAKCVIEDAAGVRVRAYRAPSFSIIPGSLWAIEILLELGFTLDSSIFPVRHDLYGFKGAPRHPFRICAHGGSLVEFPPPTLKVGRWIFPITGGGYLRVLPFGYQVRALQALEKRQEALQLYVHPWELDPEQPRIAAPLRARLRHYLGLSRTEKRLRRLLGLFHFTKLSSVIRDLPPLSDVQLIYRSHTEAFCCESGEARADPGWLN